MKRIAIVLAAFLALTWGALAQDSGQPGPGPSPGAPANPCITLSNLDNCTLAGTITVLNSPNIFNQYYTDQNGVFNFASSEFPPIVNAYWGYVAPTAALAGLGAGNVNSGTHSYVVTFVTAVGETTQGTASNVVTTTSGNGQVALSAIPVGSVWVTARKIYRTAAGGSAYKLLTTINDNTTTTYADNTADASLGASPPATNTAIDPNFSTIEGSIVGNTTTGLYLAADSNYADNIILSAGANPPGIFGIQLQAYSGDYIALGQGASISGGAPSGGGAGYSVTLSGGVAVTTGAGGAANLEGGAAAGSNQVGGTVVVAAGQSTGNVGAPIIFQAPLAGSSGSTLNALVEVGNFGDTTAGHWTFAEPFNLTGISNAAGNEILCYDTTGGPVTYESAVAGCIPSDPKLKNAGPSINPFVAMVRVWWYLHPGTYTFKDTKKYGDGTHMGFYADQVCAIDLMLCSWDQEGNLNYDKVGFLAYLTAALIGCVYSILIFFGAILLGLLTYLYRHHRQIKARLARLEGKL